MIEYKEIEYCKLQVSYQAPSSLVEEKFDESIKDLKKTKPKVSGFREFTKKPHTKRKKINRKGSRTKPFKSSVSGKVRNTKAYNFALKNAYSKVIHEAVKKELVSEAYDETLFETKIKPIGFPEVVHSQLDEFNFSCDLLFLKKPEFKLDKYKGFEIPKPHQTKTEIELAEKMLQDLRIRHGSLAVYDDEDVVELGDKITVDFICNIDEERNDKLTREGFLYTVGESVIPGIDDHLLGMKPGESKHFSFLISEDLDKELSGKIAHYNVVLHMGTKNVPAPLDDTLATKVGYSHFDDLIKEINGAASSQLKIQTENEIQQQIVNRILEGHDFKVPDFLVLEEAKIVAANAGVEWSSLSDEHKKMANEKAVKNVKLSLILDSIREEEPDTNFSDSEILSSLKERLESQGKNADQFLSSAQKNGTLFAIVASLKDEATMKWLVSQSKIIE